MITEKQYREFLTKQQKVLTEDIKEAIREQIRLSLIAQEKQSIRDELDEKSRNLIISGFKKLKEKYPDIENKLSQKEIKIEINLWVINEFLSKSENYTYIAERMKEIPELRENQKMQDELGTATFEYFNAVYDLNKRLEEDRKRFFSKEYIAKMDEYADKGILLYFLETPDIDLLDQELDENFLIDTFLYNHCYSLKVLLDKFVNIPNPSPIMRRKGEDIYVAITLLDSGYYRSAARNLFALLESEHKRCANAFEGYFTKKQKLKNGNERARKITKLVNGTSIEWEQHSWEKINNYYKNIFSNDKYNGVAYRNGIIHGDYEESAIDSDAVEVVKLVLLWINLRILADYLSVLEEGLDSMFSYITGFAISKES